MAQKQGGRRSMEDIYGDGSAGKRIADVLAGLGPIAVQKRITY